MGMSRMRQLAAAVDAAIVLTGMGRPLVESKLSTSASMPVLAAVSPNRESGP